MPNILKQFLGVIVIFGLFIVLYPHCSTDTKAWIQLSYPEKFKILEPTDDKGDGWVVLRLPLGTQVVRFEHQGKPYACVLEVIGGGEIYLGLEETQIAPIVRAQEGM